MGCFLSIPHTRRRYRDPADLDEVIVPLREFGNYRNGTTNLVPDDIDGLPSTHIYNHLASDPDTLLYEAEIDQGRAWRCFRPWFLIYLYPPTYYYLVTYGLGKVFLQCTCDEMCCWLRKEYSTRTWFRVYPNRIEVNYPQLRFFGLLGCGSWNSDNIVSHPFDRGAFGFRPVRCGLRAFLCGGWTVYGETVSRQRCQCNGSLWPRLLDCGGWWCDEWICDVCGCAWGYNGIADADETSFAAGIALQAYFEGRVISKDDMDKCLAYWKENVSEMHDPEGKKRDVCCEPFCIPYCTCAWWYENVCNPAYAEHPPCRRCCQFEEEDEEWTPEWQEIYEQHSRLREKQVDRYKNFTAPVRASTVCRKAGCRRLFGRRGLIFCTEGCCCRDPLDPSSTCGQKKPSDPAPPFEYRGRPRDIDDEHDASVVLQTVLGDPPLNVTYRRWQWDDEESQLEVVVIQPSPPLQEEARKEM